MRPHMLHIDQYFGFESRLDGPLRKCCPLPIESLRHPRYRIRSFGNQNRVGTRGDIRSRRRWRAAAAITTIPTWAPATRLRCGATSQTHDSRPIQNTAAEQARNLALSADGQSGVRSRWICSLVGIIIIILKHYSAVRSVYRIAFQDPPPLTGLSPPQHAAT